MKNIILKKVSHTIKQGILFLWVLLLLGVLGYYFYNPNFFTVDSLKNFLEQFGSALLIIYFLLSALRGFTLVPSLPFVLVGALLFPDNLFFVYIISLIGILLSSTMVYFFSREMGFEEVLLKKYPKAIKRYEKWIESYGFITVTLWSFIIIVPTDLICYIAGTLRMKFSKFLLAVAIGEGIICGVLIFGGSTITQFL